MQPNEDSASGIYGAGLRTAASIASYGYSLFQNYNSKQTSEDSVEGRNLGAEAMTNERIKTIFERYIFDSYKYQVYFNASTNEIAEKLFDAIWPFHPDN